MNKAYRFRKGDLFAVAIALALIAASFLIFFQPEKTEPANVEIYQNGRLLYTFSLYESRTIHIDGDYENTIVIENASVRITSSTCPGQDCVHTGGIHSSGQNLICLPNRLEIRLTGSSDDIDIISR